MKAWPDLHCTGRPPVGAHDLLRVPDDARVVHDRRAAVLLEERAREQADDVVAVDEPPFLVEEEAAVEVAVEGDAEVGAREAHLPRRRLAVLLEHRVRHAVREVAVRLVVDLGEPERQLLLEQVEPIAGAAVAAIADDRERLQLRGIDVREQVVAPGRLDVEGDRRCPSSAASTNSPASASLRISWSPVSPLTGRACSRTNLRPL